MRNAVHLITYADRLGGDLAGLRALVHGPLRDLAGVHVLPFFTPFDGCDAGFDPVDHTAVDPRLGTWDDVAALARTHQVCADLIVNHVSARSAAFRDWLARGEASPAHGMFLTFDRVFPKGATEADLAKIYRPRPGLPFTPYLGSDGRRHLAWTTFDPGQVDLDVEHPASRRYLCGILDRFAAAGVTWVRFDAAGYAVKSPGTSMFLTEECLAFVDEMVVEAHRRGLEVLVEFHGHHSDALRLAERTDRVYDFALPPLVLHALTTGDVGALTRWFDDRPPNAVTVLDTHDGIGIVDAAAEGDRAGLVDDAALGRLVAEVGRRTGGLSLAATREVPWQDLPYSICTTYLDALGGDEHLLLAARLLQYFTPGVPQLYYVGLLGGHNDAELFARSGQGRDVNRHHYTPDELRAALARPYVQAMLGLLRWRGTHPAFGGTSRWTATAGSVEMHWNAGRHHAVLSVDAAAGTFSLAWTDAGGLRRASTIPQVVAALAP